MESVDQGRPRCHGDIDRERDLREWNLNEVDPCDKDVWRSSVRYAMRAASQLPRRLFIHDMLEYSAGFGTFVKLSMNVPSRWADMSRCKVSQIGPLPFFNKRLF